MRTLVIGDIHGNLKALEDVLVNAKFNIENDRIICIGDYVDGWGNSFGVVRKLLEIKNQSPHRNIFLLGNHDKWFLDILNKDFSNLRNEKYIQGKYPDWYFQGGKSTYESYLSYSDEFILIHKKDFFDELEYFHLENNKLFIHAGFDLSIGFEKTVRLKKKELLWDRSLYQLALQYWHMSNNLNYKGKKENLRIGDFDKIYIGHTPTINDGFTQPTKMGNVINVDQGCKVKGVLTIWVDETDSFFQNI